MALTKVSSIMTTQATNIAELKTYGASMSDGDSLEILGYTTTGDGGGGTFYWDATSVVADNGGTVIQATGVTTGRWMKVYADGDRLSLATFGLATGATNFSVVFTAAINAHNKLYVPAGTWTLDAQVILDVSGVDVKLSHDAILKYSSAITSPAILLKGTETSTNNLTVNGVKGASTITITGADSIFAADEYIIISSLGLAYPTGRSYDYAYEINRIVSIAGDVITLREPLLLDYATTDTAEAAKVSWLTDVKISGGQLINTDSSVKDGVGTQYCIDFSIKDMVIENFNDSCIKVDYSANGRVSENQPSVFRDTDALNYGISIYRSRWVNVIHNRVKSERTAIDLTRLSANCSAVNNTCVGGINTHTVHYCVISSNTVSEGGSLIRGPYNTVTGNNYTAFESGRQVGCAEAGADGPSVITGNFFHGIYGTAPFLYSNGTIFSNNVFYVIDTDEISAGVNPMFRVHNSLTEKGLLFSDNIIEYVGTGTSTACIDASIVMGYHHNNIFRGNFIRGFNVGFDLSTVDDTATSTGLVVESNTIYASAGAVVFRLTANILIKGNTFIGDSTAGSIGINKLIGGSTVFTGLIMKDNIIRNFLTGIKSASPAITECIVSDNVILGATTAKIAGASLTAYVP
jgi:hypothetical protein